ncbi:MAG TPA: hypothetical protein IGP91_03785 [Thermosynechococcus sp. M46_R2017_013]|nr:hypothetical protein [Thermosynechococcus sp. M46_R2017_013]
MTSLLEEKLRAAFPPKQAHLRGSYEFDLVIRGQVHGELVLVLGEVKSNITESKVERF